DHQGAAAHFLGQQGEGPGLARARRHHPQPALAVLPHGPMHGVHRQPLVRPQIHTHSILFPHWARKGPAPRFTCRGSPYSLFSTGWLTLGPRPLREARGRKRGATGTPTSPL